MDFVGLEHEIFRMVKTLGVLVMEKVMEEADNRLFEQANRPGKSEGFREMGIQTLFGEICYRRRLYRNQRTWHYPTKSFPIAGNRTRHWQCRERKRQPRGGSHEKTGHGLE